MLHAVTTDNPTTAAKAEVSAGLKAQIDAGLRFGLTGANTAALSGRATWANNLQAQAEASALGIPFVLSAEPSHAPGNGREKAKGYSQWPHELSLAASDDLAVIEKFGQVVSQEYRAIGVRMALSPSADLFTDPRWEQGIFSFGEDSAKVSARVAAYIKGLQGEPLGATGVAAVVGHFPGAGAAKDGNDGRLGKGKFLSYAGDNVDAHLAAFEKAFEGKVAGVMPAYGIPEAGAWKGLGGNLDGTTLEQVGASFNKTLITDVLRENYKFGGLVVAPQGILEDAGLSPLGAPWGMESSTKAQRVAKAINAGVDQFVGLADAAPISAALTAGDITEAQIEASAKRALSLIFSLGLAENPYVNAEEAPGLANTDVAYQGGLNAMNRGMVLLINEDKPAGWLNGSGDGSQKLDKGNAGNGSKKVLPAPPGEPYVAAGCRYFVTGNFDLDYIRSVSAGYGEMTNDASIINKVPVSTAAERMAMSDYVFIRLNAPFSADPDSGELNVCGPNLEYAGSDNAALLDQVAQVRAAIDAWNADKSPTDPLYSKTQIVVGVDGGRPSVVDELLAYGVSGLYVEWGVTDKVFLDVAFGIVNGTGKLPVGLPASNATASTQKSDLAGDGQHPTFVEGFGLQTTMF